MNKLSFAVVGCGFWSHYQISAWREFDNIDLVAVCDQNIGKAKLTAQKFNISRFYDNAENMFANENLDFVDIITDVDTHAPLVRLAACKKIAVICQKPMAPYFALAKQMVNECELKDIPFFVHENFRWQAPIRKVKELLESGKIGKVFKARISFCSGFPVFDNQPFLKDLDQFILTDIGSHLFDVLRFLLGEADDLYCLIKTVNPAIKGEDVANVMLKMKSGVHCFVEMSYASILEYEVFPQTIIVIEGEKGSIHLSPDFIIKLTNREETIEEVAEPKLYSWVNLDYANIHSSMVETHKNLLDALMNIEKAETTGTDNLKTLQLVFAAYESARTNKVIKIDELN